MRKGGQQGCMLRGKDLMSSARLPHASRAGKVLLFVVRSLTSDKGFKISAF